MFFTHYCRPRRAEREVGSGWGGRWSSQRQRWREQQNGCDEMTDFSTIPEPGWYYADGDPIGTHRYWDGAQWVGGPQPVAGAVAAGAVGHDPFAGRYAGWGQRFGAWLIDLLIWGVPYGVAAYFAEQEPVEAWPVVSIVLYLVSLGFSIANSWIYQGLTGQSVGKRALGIQIVRDRDGSVPGIGIMIGRGLLSGVFTTFSCYIYFLLDHLWPLWDDRSKRLTDKIVNCSVVKAAA